MSQGAAFILGFAAVIVAALVRSAAVMIAEHLRATIIAWRDQRLLEMQHEREMLELEAELDRDNDGEGWRRS